MATAEVRHCTEPGELATAFHGPKELQQNISPIPLAFLNLLVFWLTILFGTFGLFAPRNATVVLALVLSATAVSSGIGLVIDMTDPFSGFVRISGGPMHHALETTRKSNLVP
jgi:hypothetical protein